MTYVTGQNDITNITDICISFCPIVITFNSSRKKPLPLSGAGELKPLLQVEEEGARLAKFLNVNLEGLK